MSKLLADLIYQKNTFISFLFLFIGTTNLFSQKKNDSIDIFFYNIINLKLEKTKIQLKNKSINYHKALDSLHLLLIQKKEANFKSLNHENIFFKNQNDTYTKILSLLIKGYSKLYIQNSIDQAFNFFSKTIPLYKKTSSNELKKFCLISLLETLVKQNIQANKSYEKFLNQYKIICKSEVDWLLFYTYKFSLLAQTETFNVKESKNKHEFNIIFKKLDSIAKNIDNNQKIKYKYYFNKGDYLIREKPDSALTNYKKCYNLIYKNDYFKSVKKIIYLRFYRVYIAKKEYSRALYYLYKSQEFMQKDNHVDLFVLNSYKANTFKKMNILDSAIYYENKAKYNQINWDLQKQNMEISRMKVKLNTDEKEEAIVQQKQQIVISESKRKQSQNFLYISLAFLVLSGTIGLLTLKNSRKKRLLAEQQKELEKQKSLTLIKEHEINTINAMIDGQEKERIRIAEDLHDNIGSVLATLKLHFENLKLNREKEHFNQDELYAKTEKLIDETYLKVRSIAHAKNAGVIANKGLLVAVKLMAEKISDANKITIHVLDFGLDKRLDNQLEINVFRIIQELITNIIKHANATEATINISLFDKNLNIIIEDNGQGFNYDKINLKEGIGISSIKTRINHLKGTFEVDSTINKGTSIIINLPV